MVRSRLRLAALAAALALAASACTGTSDETAASRSQPPTASAVKTLGAGEGALQVLTLPGYVEDGTSDPDVDWVTPFEEQTGCTVRVQVASSAEDVAARIGTGAFDVVSVGGWSSRDLIFTGKVQPLNPDLLSSYADVYPFQKGRPWNAVDGVVYGLPQGWGAALLAWRTDVVTPAPSSWAVIWGDSLRYRGRLAVPDVPAHLADAALHLMETRPELGIEHPFALDREQFDAALALATAQRGSVGDYWTTEAESGQALQSGRSVVGVASQQTVTGLAAGRVPVQGVLPPEGSTGWATSWLVDARAAHPNCAYRWLNWVSTPEVQVEASAWVGEAPANAKACRLPAGRATCSLYHADDPEYFERIWFGVSPQADCLDGRTDVACVAAAEWSAAWRALRAG